MRRSHQYPFGILGIPGSLSFPFWIPLRIPTAPITPVMGIRNCKRFAIPAEALCR